MNSINLVIKLGVLTCCCGCGGVGEGEGEEAVEDVAEAAGLEEDCECEADTVTGELRRFLSLGISEIRLFREAQFDFCSVFFTHPSNVLITNYIRIQKRNVTWWEMQPLITPVRFCLSLG